MKRFLSILAICFAAIGCKAANPAFNSFNANQFDWISPNIWIQDTSLQTNVSLWGQMTVNNPLSATDSMALFNHEQFTVFGTNLTDLIGIGTLNDTTPMFSARKNNGADGLVLINPTNITASYLGGVSVIGASPAGKLGAASTLSISRTIDGITALETFDDYSTGVPAAGTMTNGYGFYTGAAFSNAVIGTQTFLDGTDQFLEITNGFYSRQLSVSNNWKAVRIGLVITITPNGTSTIGNGLLCYGLSSSIGPGYQGFYTATCSNFFGYSSAVNNTNGQSLTYTATPQPHYSGGSDRGLFINLQSNVSTNKSTSPASGVILIPPYGVSSLRRVVTAVVLHRVSADSGNIANSLIGNNVTTWAQFDWDNARFANVMKPGVMTATVPLDSGVTASSPVAVTTTETQGNLDSVNIWWNNPTNALQIYSVAVRAFY